MVFDGGFYTLFTLLHGRVRETHHIKSGSLSNVHFYSNGVGIDAIYGTSIRLCEHGSNIPYSRLTVQEALSFLMIPVNHHHRHHHPGLF